MKILHVSNFGDKHNGRLFWNQCFKISNGFIRNGHSVLNFSDRDKSRAYISNRIYNNKKLQNDLIETIDNFNPELIVLGHADRIHVETLERIRKKYPGIKIVEWNVDNLLLDNTKKKLIQRSRLLDGIFSTTADKLLSDCVNNNFVTFFPNIVDKSIDNLQIFNLDSHKNDIFFALSHGVGTGKLRKKNNKKESLDERVIFFRELKKLSPHVMFDLYGLDGIQPIWANVFLNKIKDSYMGICLQRKPLLKYSLSDRIAQYLGNGLMVFIEKETEFNEFLKDKEDAVFFDDVYDLSKKIEYYKENKYEAIRIASNGYDKIHTYCNERVVTSYFIDCLNGKKEDMLDRYIWPIHIFK